MAEKCFPLEHTMYKAADAQMWFATRTSGVYAAEHLPVTANGTMSLTLGTGIAWLHYDTFAGCVYGNTDNRTLTANMSDAALDRIDRVCIRLEMLNNRCYAYIKRGVPSSVPEPPDLQRDNVAYEISVAKIHVCVGATGINAGDITDERLDAEVCGLMSDGVTAIDTSVIQAQFADLIVKLQAELQKAYEGIEKVNLIERSATLLASGWSETEPYSQTVAVEGVLGADRPTVDCDLSSAITLDEMTAINDAWGSVLKAESGAGTLTVYFSGIPEQDIPIKIQVVR